MRTNIVLDDVLIEEAMRLTQTHTKKEVVNHALTELVVRYRQRALRDLVGRELRIISRKIEAMNGQD